MDINQLYTLGQQIAIQQGKDREASKVGTLRAGNTGMVLESGEVVSVCAARTFLRQQGIDTGGDDEADGSRLSKELMFEAGRNNEEIWTANLERAGARLKREEEIPTSWMARNGRKEVAVTGRPDMVLLGEAGEPIRGIELKLVSSLWKARSSRFQKKPSMEHLLQSGHYSWQLQIPFELWYTARSNYAVTGDWVQRMFPKYGEPGSEDCAYSFFRNSLNEEGKLTRSKIDQSEWVVNDVQLTGMSGWKGRENRKTVNEYEADIKAVLPFRQGFAVEWNADGQLEYAEILPDGTRGEWVETIITLERIERFYNFVAELGAMNQVPTPPLNLESDGQKGSFNLADYCNLGKLCCKYTKGQDLTEWTEKIKEVRDISDK